MGKAFRPMFAAVGTVLLLIAISPQSMAHQDAGVSRHEAEPVLDMYVGRLNESSSTTRGRSAPPDDRTERVARNMVDLIESGFTDYGFAIQSVNTQATLVSQHVLENGDREIIATLSMTIVSRLPAGATSQAAPNGVLTSSTADNHRIIYRHSNGDRSAAEILSDDILDPYSD